MINEKEITRLALVNSYERGLVRKALEIAAEQFQHDAGSCEPHKRDWTLKISQDMRELRSRIERDPKTGW